VWLLRSATEIAEALVNGGPLSAAFDVHEDFENYVEGVYQHVVGSFIGRHAVRIVGYGVTETGLKYWRISNSWNPYWGEHGFFRIIRGVDHCRIESEAVVGLGGAWSKGVSASLKQLQVGRDKQLRLQNGLGIVHLTVE